MFPAGYAYQNRLEKNGKRCQAMFLMHEKTISVSDRKANMKGMTEMK